MNLVTLFLTCADKEEADKISAKLLDDKLVACVRQSPVTSDYWWAGKREQADEVQLIIESSEDNFDKIEAAVRQLHSYDTFVLTAHSIARSSEGVQQWVEESIR